MKKFFIPLCCLLASFNVFSQTRNSFMSHSDEVISILNDNYTNDGSYFSISKDGFVVRWNAQGMGAHYQITDNQIVLAAMHPSKQEFAVYETDGNSVNLISIWDWKTLTRKTSINFTDSILSLTYSKKGTWLIAGTSTDKGTVFINSTNGSVVSPISDKMNMMSFIETANSEKSLMSYSLTGNICYYSFESKKLAKRIPVTSGLEDIITFNRFKYIAGMLNKKISIFDATNGKSIYELTAVNPLLTKYAESLYYYDRMTSKSGALFKFEITEGQISKPSIYKNIVSKYNDPISSILLTDTRIIFGSVSGNIYEAEITDSSTLELNLVTTDKLHKIYDSTFINKDLFILTNRAIFKTSEDQSDIIELSSNPGFNNATAYKDKLILWSSVKDMPVSIFDSTTKKIVALFKPKGQVLSIKFSGDQLIDVESGTTVNRYNFDTNTIEELYYGSGIQDAAMLSQEDLFIAKASTSSIDSSLLYVNTRTHETVPIKIPVDYVYAVAADLSGQDTSSVYAIGIKNDDKKSRTILFKYNSATRTVELLHEYANLNFRSFIAAFDQIVFNNIENSRLASVNAKTKKLLNYNRTCGLPSKITANADYAVTVNKDGGLSWIDPKSQEIFADWYITSENIIVEY